MSRFYTIDAANERLPEVRPLLERLRDERAELVALRDAALARAIAIGGTRPAQGALFEDEERDGELHRIRLRMQGLVDQMQAAVAHLDEWDVTLRDIERGLIDFPALVSGRQVWLCWRLGEGDVGWWHELEAGFAARRPLIDLE